MSDSKSEFVSHVESLDPKGDEFSDLFKIVARKVSHLRREESKLPPNLYLSDSEMHGINESLEVIVLDKEGNLYLRRREKEENVNEEEEKSWGGKLHIPGTTIFSRKRFEMNLYSLLEREVVGGTGREKSLNLANLYRKSKTVGSAMLPQPERKSDVLKIYEQVVIDDQSVLRDGYERVTKENLDQVISEHRPVVERILAGKKGPFIFDTRGRSDAKMNP